LAKIVGLFAAAAQRVREGAQEGDQRDEIGAKAVDVEIGRRRCGFGARTGITAVGVSFGHPDVPQVVELGTFGKMKRFLTVALAHVRH